MENSGDLEINCNRWEIKFHIKIIEFYSFQPIAFKRSCERRDQSVALMSQEVDVA